MVEGKSRGQRTGNSFDTVLEYLEILGLEHALRSGILQCDRKLLRCRVRRVLTRRIVGPP